MSCCPICSVDLYFRTAFIWKTTHQCLIHRRIPCYSTNLTYSQIWFDQFPIRTYRLSWMLIPYCAVLYPSVTVAQLFLVQIFPCIIPVLYHSSLQIAASATVYCAFALLSSVLVQQWRIMVQRNLEWFSRSYTRQITLVLGSRMESLRSIATYSMFTYLENESDIARLPTTVETITIRIILTSLSGVQTLYPRTVHPRISVFLL
jgi:hypothetical protein